MTETTADALDHPVHADRDAPARSTLDRTIDVARVTPAALAWALVLLVGAVLRLLQLGLHPLSASEAERAFDAYALFRGDTEGPFHTLPDTGPTGLLLRSLTIFLFGDSDGSVRLVSALLGIGLIGLVFALRRELGGLRALGAAALIAISPTAIYSSRTVNDAMVAAFFGLLLVVAVYRLGRERRAGVTGAALLLGFALAALFGSGPAALSLLLAVIVGLGVGYGTSGADSAVGRAIARLGSAPRETLIPALVAFLVTLVALFTRLFSAPGEIVGAGTTIADWGRLISTAAGTTPTQFFLLAILLYELLAVVLAIATVVMGSERAGRGASIDWPMPAAWFLAAFLLFSFSVGRSPEHAILVALPLLVLAGIGLGDILERLLAARATASGIGSLLLASIGVVIALFAIVILLGRVDSAVNRANALVQVLAAAVIALAPLLVVAISLADRIRRTGGPRVVSGTVLLAVAAVLALLGFRSAVETAFYNADTGRELLAQGTSTAGTREIARRFHNLSRDLTAGQRNPANPEGGRGLSIAVDERVQWPFRWYFRDYPNLQVVAEGQALANDPDVAIAPDDSGMIEAGFQPRQVAVINRVPSAYTAPSIGTVLKHALLPSYWQEGVRYLLYRELADPPEPVTVAFGYSGMVAQQVEVDTGPFSLFERVGPGSGRGQFLEPRGIAVSPDGARVYVVDTLNARVEVFAENGEVIAIWGDGDAGDTLELELTENGLGPGGIAVGEDGLVYVADTWNHRIVVLDPDGRVVRSFGEFSDDDDATDPNLNPGGFFGPRAVAVHGDEIYVSDTGNERVQVFALDGTFRRAFGGTGSAPNQLIEPVGLTVGPDGRVYVADSGNGRISVFDAQGAPVVQWPVDGWIGAAFFEPYLAFGVDGRLYASSAPTSSVLVFDPATGAQVDEIVDVEGVSLAAPSGIAAGPDGEILIADRGLSIVVRYLSPLVAPDGVGNEDVEDLPLGADTGDASPVASPVGSPQASPVAAPGNA